MLKITHQKFETFIYGSKKIWLVVAAVPGQRENQTLGIVKMAKRTEDGLEQFVEVKEIMLETAEAWTNQTRLKKVQEIKGIDSDIDIVEAEVEA